MAERDRIAEEAIRKELTTLDILLTAKAARTTITLEEYINARLAQGATLEVIKQALFDDLANNGRIFRELINGLKPTFSGSINRFRDVGQLAETGISQTYRWSAVLVNTCPDCLQRHNKTMSWEEWEAEGLPRTGATICREHCQCVLLPEEATELEPIKRGK